jgi:hypothetical protein
MSDQAEGKGGYMSEKSDQRKAVRMLKKAGFHVSKGKRMDLTTLLLKCGIRRRPDGEPKGISQSL